MSTTVIACIQQIPHADAEGQVLEVKDIQAAAGTYLEAVDAVHSQVPEGWRVLYVRSADSPPAETTAGTVTTDDEASADKADVEHADDAPERSSDEHPAESPEQ